MSKGIEKLLKRMIVPKVDLRCDATDALTDAYWGGDIEAISHSTFLPLLNLRYVPVSKRFHFCSIHHQNAPSAPRILRPRLSHPTR